MTARLLSKWPRPPDAVASSTDDHAAAENETRFVEVDRADGPIEFRGGLIVATAPSDEDRQAAISASGAFEAAAGSFATLTEASPTIELARVTNETSGEVDPETLEFTPTFVDRLVWMIVYEDVEWNGIGGGPAAIPGVQSDGQPEGDVGLSDAVILVDATTGTPVHAFTDHASYENQSWWSVSVGATSTTALAI